MPKIVCEIPKDAIDKETKAYISKLERENKNLKQKVETLKREINTNENQVRRVQELIHYIRDNCGDLIDDGNDRC